MLLAGCYGSTPPVVKLGLIAPFEELYREDGYAVLHAVRLAVNQRNAAGGVAGRQVALVALNDNGQPAEARQQAANLGVDPAVLAVIGPLQSATVEAAGPELAAQGLPWIGLASVTPEQQPGGFTLDLAPESVASIAARLLASSGVSGPIARVDDLTSVPDELGGAIWLGDAAGGARLALQLPLQTALAGGPALGSPVFAGRAGQAAEGALWLSAGPGIAGLPVDFIAAYRALAGGDPPPQAVLAYDGANLLLDALDLAGQQDGAITRATVRQALLALGAAGWQGLSGQVAWQEDVCLGGAPCWPRLDPPAVVHSW